MIYREVHEKKECYVFGVFESYFLYALQPESVVISCLLTADASISQYNRLMTNVYENYFTRSSGRLEIS